MQPTDNTNILFLGLTTFSKMGGIEKFNRCLLKGLSEINAERPGLSVKSFSLYDDVSDENYFQNKNYKGYEGSKLSFVFNSIRKARKFDKIVVGHINMAVIGYFIKFFFPKKHVMVVIHGYEGWSPLKGFQKRIMQKADTILAVSPFTRNKIVSVQKVEEKKVKLFYNTIDPYFGIPTTFKKQDYLKKRYDIKENDFVIFTLARLAFTDGYKGYDIVMKCLPELSKTIPNIKYVIAGKYDEAEKARLDKIIQEHHLEKYVIFTGFIAEEEVKDHYQMSDVFIMPSLGEGFGIVFIEAMSCGLPVIGGNKDGSQDALRNGELGIVVNPTSQEEITLKLKEVHQNKASWTTEDKFKLQQKTLNYFGFDQFKKQIDNVLIQNN